MGLFGIFAVRRIFTAFQLARNAFTKEVCAVLLGAQNGSDPLKGSLGKLRLGHVGPKSLACHDGCITHIR